MVIAPKGEATEISSVVFDQTLADGILHQRGTAVKVQFRHQVLSVAIDSAEADLELFGDFLAGPLLGNQAQDLLLPFGQAIGSQACAVHVCVAYRISQQALGQCRVKIDVACGDRPHGHQQFVR